MSKIKQNLDPRLQAMLEEKAGAFVPDKASTLILAGENFDAENMKRIGFTVIPLTKEIWSVRGDTGLLNKAVDEGLVDENDYLEATRSVAPMLNRSVSAIRATPEEVAGSFEGANATDVVIGIVDYGIDWTLPDFCDASGCKTRIKFLWDQSLESKGDERVPHIFDHGVEYDESAINSAICEWRAGRHTDALKMVRHRPIDEHLPTDVDGHGTHVAGIAAGNGASVGSCGDCSHRGGPFVGVASNAWLVFVSLDRQVILDSIAGPTGTLANSADLAEAIVYCFQKANELAETLERPIPCVVNLSMGFNGGSHDGTGLVERVIDSMLETRGRAVTVAAGNQQKNQTYYTGTLKANQPANFAWKFGLGSKPDPSPNEMEIWYSSRDEFKVSLVTGPNANQELGPIGVGERQRFIQDHMEVLIDSRKDMPLNGDSRIYIRVTPFSESDSARAQPTQLVGSCTIRLECENPRYGVFDAWIEKEAGVGIGGESDPYQSRFGDLGIDVRGRRLTRITTPATAFQAIAVGAIGHIWARTREYVRSGSGPTRDGRPKPEIVAVGVDVCSNNVVLGRGQNFRCFQAKKSGTSMAAPHVAGVVALMLKLNPKLSSDQIRKILIDTANKSFRGDKYHPVWGFGLVDARKALETVRQDFMS